MGNRKKTGTLVWQFIALLYNFATLKIVIDSFITLSIYYVKNFINLHFKPCLHQNILKLKSIVLFLKLLGYSKLRFSIKRDACTKSFSRASLK